MALGLDASLLILRYNTVVSGPDYWKGAGAEM